MTSQQQNVFHKFSAKINFESGKNARNFVAKLFRSRNFPGDYATSLKFHVRLPLITACSFWLDYCGAKFPLIGKLCKASKCNFESFFLLWVENSQRKYEFSISPFSRDSSIFLTILRRPLDRWALLVHTHDDFATLKPPTVQFLSIFHRF